jgi:hypothetical protein
MKNTSTLAVAMATCALLAAAACGDGGQTGDPGGAGDDDGNGDGNGGGGDPAAGSAGTTPGTGAGAPGMAPIQLKTDYGEALRTASLKLVGELPALADIKAIAAATSDADKKKVYVGLVDKYLADPRFATTQIAWWRNTLKTGADPSATPAAGAPSMDTAATFAAQVVVEDKAFTELLTATTGTCPTFAGGTFTAANCTNKAMTAGILTDPGLMAQYTSNMAFRRVRFVQETFACSKFPAEVQLPGKSMGAGLYTSPWDFQSIAGGTGAKIDFHDTSAVICANCHTTMNHLAPLFANFDSKGQLTAAIAVQTPVTPPVTTVLGDWLPSGQGTAWRNGVAVSDLPALGAAMAKDPDVSRCAVIRTWNWAFSRGDVVNDGATLPVGVIEATQAAFVSNGMKMKGLIRSVFTSDEFTRF